MRRDEDKTIEELLLELEEVERRLAINLLDASANAKFKYIYKQIIEKQNAQNNLPS